MIHKAKHQDYKRVPVAFTVEKYQREIYKMKNIEPLGNAVGVSPFPPYFDEKFNLGSATPADMISPRLDRRH